MNRIESKGEKNVTKNKSNNPLELVKENNISLKK